MFTHYHPEYVHAHDGALQPHEHSGHFHSHELDSLARIFDFDEAPLRPGETHHHSENLPGSDSETVQYDFNHSGITKVIKLALEFQPGTTAISFIPTKAKEFKSQQISSDTNRTLLLRHNHSERSPPLRV